MTPAAICMMVIGLALTWGGATLCIYIGMTRRLKKNKKTSPGDHAEGGTKLKS